MDQTTTQDAQEANQYIDKPSTLLEKLYFLLPTRRDIAKACANLASATRKLKIMIEQVKQCEIEHCVDDVTDAAKFLYLLLQTVQVFAQHPVLSMINKVALLATTPAAKKCTIAFAKLVVLQVANVLGVFCSLVTKVHDSLLVNQQQVVTSTMVVQQTTIA